jgi:hypothetical protein
MTASQLFLQLLFCVAAHIIATTKFTREANLSTCMIVVDKDSRTKVNKIW